MPSRAWAVCGALAVAAGAWNAATAADLPPPRFSGSYWGVEAGAGWTASSGLNARAGVRAASLLQIADAALQYAASSGRDGQLHRGTLSAQVHPFFFFMLTGEGLWQALAGIYVRTGVGVGGYATAGRPLEAVGTLDWGVGLDAPLTPPDAGRSVWLGLEYLRTSALGDAQPWETPIQDLTLRVSWRVNVL
jgi:hypothetical protein